ncbi:hypothetical protein F4054_18195 [Candidatus Poribacteria bacterium]|nr:hypothetical protein [Candidatus Poribacteria bacterium]MYG05758.1 hypothetical protein [Candidatus Poribacteria bacterium]MYK24174.1 hypothetical protein [Candidatus Poribacteria bacterium]
MDPKKMLTRPEKTVEAAEKEKQASAEGHAKVCDEEPTLQDVDQFLSQAEKNPERLKAKGKEIGVDYSYEAENAGLMRTGMKILRGEPISEEEDAAFREDAVRRNDLLGESIRKESAQKTPEERAKTANLIIKLLGRFIPREFLTRKLMEINYVDSEEPSEPDDKENA